MSARLPQIRDHYDRMAFFYRAFWGEHIHHGYWNGEESTAAAQVRLVERLAERACIPVGARVLDVGCGLGGSSFWLAQNLRCSVLGVTISAVQAAIAAREAHARNLHHRVRIEVRDAERLDLPREGFDAVWVIEASEHFRGKQRFIANCARVLRPGGALALCAWVRGDRPASSENDGLLATVCAGMLCPSLASMREYRSWMESAGFATLEAEDITRRVEKTWRYCEALARRPEIALLLRIADPATRRFVRTFGLIRRAYAEGIMAYGMFVARKPGGRQ